MDVGTGVFVDFSLLEALRFCHEKIYHLDKQLQLVQDRALDVQTHLDLMLSAFEALRQTLQIPTVGAGCPDVTMA